MFNSLLKKATEVENQIGNSFAALAAEAANSRPGSPAVRKQNSQGTDPGSPAGRKAVAARPRAPGSPAVGSANPHSSNARLASQLDEAHQDIESFQKLLQNAALEKMEATRTIDQLGAENGTLSQELRKARAMIKALRVAKEKLEDSATDASKDQKQEQSQSQEEKKASNKPSEDTSDPLGATGSHEAQSARSSLSLTTTAAEPLENAARTEEYEARISALEMELESVTDQQATDAKEYLILKEALAQRTLDLERQKQEHDEKMKKMKAIFAAANKNLNEYRTSIAAKDEEIATLQVQLEAIPSPQLVEQENNKIVEDLQAELVSQASSSAAKLDSVEGRLKQTNTQLEKLKEEYQQYKQRASALLQQQQEDKANVAESSQSTTLLQQLEAAVNENRLLALDLRRAESAKATLESDHQLALDQISTLEAGQETTRRLERQYERVSKELEKAQEESRRDRATAEARIVALEELHLVEAQSLRLELGGSAKHIEERLVKKEEENAELHRILDRSEEELSTAKADLAKLQEQLETMVKAEGSTGAGVNSNSSSRLIPSRQNSLQISTTNVGGSGSFGPRSSISQQDQDSPISRPSSSMSLPVERPAYATLSDLLASKPIVDRSSPFTDPSIAAAQSNAALSAAKERDYQLKLQHLTDLLNESEKSHQRLLDQEKLLKEEIRSQDRADKRQNLSIDYLKNIVLKFLEASDREPLVPVLSTVLQLSPAEVMSIRKKAVPSSTASSVFTSILGR